METTFIDILIPTYNREKFILKNLNLLTTSIKENNLQNEVGIIISDNCSKDETRTSVENFIETNRGFKISYFLQEKNKGATHNIIFLVGKSVAPYFMILGDDDYLNSNYLKTVIEILKNDKSVKCILNACNKIDVNGKLIKKNNDINNEVYTEGFQNVYSNIHRMNILSGIVIKNENMYQLLLEKKVKNEYPHIFMACYSCLFGKTFYVSDFPRLITADNIQYWKYDSLGFLNDIYENFKLLPITNLERFILEKEIYKRQKWRILYKKKYAFKKFWYVFTLSFSKNTSTIGRFLHPLIILKIRSEIISNKTSQKFKNYIGKYKLYLEKIMKY
ncbi:MAG: glycosyltransferase [Muribaculaceae bacterium]|nr:glycosyltransferase [Muribaculaceae bacterium]